MNHLSRDYAETQRRIAQRRGPKGEFSPILRVLSFNAPRARHRAEKRRNFCIELRGKFFRAF
jgi:hypothetical protein